MHWRRKWQPTPVFLPGESQGRGSLVGCHLWGRTESDTTEATQQPQQQWHEKVKGCSLNLKINCPVYSVYWSLTTKEQKITKLEKQGESYGQHDIKETAQFSNLETSDFQLSFWLNYSNVMGFNFFSMGCHHLLSQLIRVGTSIYYTCCVSNLLININDKPMRQVFYYLIIYTRTQKRKRNKDRLHISNETDLNLASQFDF